MKVAYLGPQGSYTEEAARQKYPDGDLLSCVSIEQVFRAVATSHADCGVVPIENMIQGPVTETQDALYDFHEAVCIIDMQMLSIAHTLGCCGDPHQIEKIFSKDQALKQCSSFLQEHFPLAELIEVDSTSAAIEHVTSTADPGFAAIGSGSTIEEHQLNVVAHNIGNVQDNKTRFAVLGSRRLKNTSATGADATALVIYPPGDRVGILEEILSVISRDCGLSLSSIHSRPDRRGAFRFYLELEGHIQDQAVQQCIGALQRKLTDDLAEIVVFGSYPRRPFIQANIATIGIIGGTGKMGQWFAQLFERAGYKVLIQGRRTELSLEQCIQGSDAVLINVPIKHSVEVASTVGPLVRPGKLVLDNTSVKGEVVATLLNSVQEGVEVLGMHTIFGPTIDSLRKRNVIFTRTDKSNHLAKEFENIFYKYGARISYADEFKHDRQMAFHQNLEHFTKLVLSKVLSTQFDQFSDTQSYSSPNSKASLQTMARVLNLDPELLIEIQGHNTEGPAMLRAFVDQATELLGMLERGEYAEVEQFILHVKSSLGDEFLHSLQS